MSIGDHKLRVEYFEHMEVAVTMLASSPWWCLTCTSALPGRADVAK
jgi:hypothetical protein